ncbi:MAG: hypothetical protein OYH77_07880 [Pseudomonadota bacterium]|nr:hypothetical protein [Pseudomonadota bacterium]
MSDEKRSEPFPPQRFEGEIIVDEQGSEHRFPVHLTVSVDNSGQLKLDTDPIYVPINMILVLKGLLGRPGKDIPLFKLECESKDGKRLTSDSAHLTSCYDSFQVGDAKAKITVTIRTFTARLNMSTADSSTHTVLVFRLPMFKCFPSFKCKTSVGVVQIAGAAKTVKQNELSGIIHISALENNNPNDWQKRADQLLKRLRLVLSFARGASLFTPIVECYHQGNVEVTFYSGGRKGNSDMMPPIPHLALHEFIPSVVPVVEKMDNEKWGALGTAINWWLVPTSYREVRLLTAITALECAVYNFANLKKCECHPSYKHPPLKCRIEHLLNKLVINRDVIEHDKIEAAIKVRNRIVHNSYTPENNADDKELWESVLTVREVMVRIVLSLLEFKGNYSSYVGGMHLREFPSCKLV